MGIPHFSQTLRSQGLKALRSKALNPFKREEKKQHTVETLILSGFGYIRVVACKNYFVRNAGNLIRSTMIMMLTKFFRLFTAMSVTFSA